MKKSLKVNYIYNLFYQVLIMVLPLIVTPYLSRVLGAEKIGIYSYTMSIVSYFILFGCIGINLYGQRKIAAVQDNKKERSKIFYELFLLKLTTIIISLLFYAVFYYNGDYAIYYRILIIELLSNILDITWYYQGIEDFKKITIRNTIVRLMATLLIFIFVRNQNDLINYFLIYTISNSIGYVLLWKRINKELVKVKINIKSVLNHIKPSISFFIPQIAMQIYTVLDKTMLGTILSDMSEVGYYEQSQKIVKTCLMIITALGTVMVPRIANLYANKKTEELNEKISKVFQIVSFITFPLCFGIIGVSNNFVPWFFGEGYEPIINLLIIFSFLLIAIGLNNITGIQYLITTGKQKVFTITVVIGAISNFILNLILIPKLKAEGSAIASVVAEFLILIVQIFYLRKTFDFKKILLSNIKYLVYSIIMLIVVILIGMNLSQSFTTLIIQILAGIMTYGIILLITKEPLLNEIMRIIKKKVKR